MKEQEIIDIEEIDVQSTELAERNATQMTVAHEIVSMEKLMEMAEMLSKSTIVPVNYQRRPENCIIALDMANRMGVSPMVVMQNLYVIQGKPSFSGSAIASMIRSSPQFTNVELNYVGKEGTDSFGAYVSATRKSNGAKLKGGTVTIGTAKKEGWYQKTGSKWQTMPEIMLAYRAYAWFARVYAPELVMGMQSVEEVEDVERTKTQAINPYEKGTIN